MKKTLGAIAVAVALGASASASAVTIDLFSTDQAYLTDTVIDGVGLFSQVAEAGLPVGNILGGYRDLGVETKVSTNPAVRNASIGVDTGAVSFNTDSGASGTGMILWDGSHAATGFTDVNTTGLGGVDLGSPFASSFQLDIVFADAGFDFILTAWTDDTHWSSVKLNSLAHPVPGVSLIPFLAFLDCDNMIPGAVTTCAGSPGSWNPVDFSSVGALQALIDPLGTFVSLDLTLDSVTTVPEPGSLVLAGLGLLALGGIRRRRSSL
ncbi:PEP-CTERM sorting domain-containing protein [Accumulibacter sp.]|jgi:MYXO-CTERM domain-containing protein|uniref:Ice-binding protein C-terminal domain-containing protein n=1 Tax=Accumulibacter regalis TaxID=522306 RepID=C7RU38_ACCRE|nr:PEP-CTERM sorting domain-containing protein [Accumulibacter sp.]MBN8496147.1 PEP-CTERM sorting domain-containing protein [Accumulibacter sp.]MBO3716173.1 PEP-CTERM sorting domain-containing protein [Accumulibacter sp.]